MFVSEKYKFVYLNPARTGSRSITQVLKSQYDAEMVIIKSKTTETDTYLVSSMHMCHLLSKYENYFVFASVRNPITHFISHKRYSHGRNKWSWDTYISQLPHLSHYSLEYSLGQNSDYVPPEGCIPVRIDYLIKLETIEEDFNNLPFVKTKHEFPQIGFNEPKDNPELTDAQIQQIIQYRKRDFEIFGYQPELAKDFWSKIHRYQLARQKWNEHGGPLRTKQEIASIYNDICKPCEHFENGSCGVCGCRLALDRTSLNKIAMATEKCPIGKWPAKIEPSHPPVEVQKMKEAPKAEQKKKGCGCGK